MGKIEELEKELYESKKERSYTKMTSLLGGTFCSGIGYAVTSTGFFVKSLLNSIWSDMPHLLDGIDPCELNGLYSTISKSLYSANAAGGMGAAVGMIGGILFFGRVRDTMYSILRR